MRIFTASAENVTISSALDLVSVKGSSNKLSRLRKALFVMCATTLMTAQGFRVRVRYSGGALTQGSGGSAFTAVPLDPGDTAYGGTCRINDTSQATTAGTFVNITPGGGHVYGGFKFDWGHEGPTWTSTNGIVFDLPSTVSGTCIFSYMVEFGEEG